MKKLNDEKGPDLEETIKKYIDNEELQIQEIEIHKKANKEKLKEIEEKVMKLMSCWYINIPKKILDN